MSTKASALEIVLEYVEAKEPALRCNAATALATLGSRESIRELMSLALRDREPEVRERAIAELRELPAETISDTVGVGLAEGLAQKATRRRAYLLLTRIPGLGGPAGLSWWQRLSLAAMPSLERPDEHWRFRWRPLRLGLFGGLVGALALALLLATVVELEGLGETMAALFAFGVPIAALYATVATQRANPFALHAERGLGLLVECGFPALLAGLVSSAAALVLLLVVSDARSAFSLGVWVTATSVVTTAAIRLGTILALGKARPTARWVLAVLGGSAAGLGALSACRVLGLSLLGADFAERETLEISAVLLMPAIVALAVTLAASDRGHPPVIGDRGRLAAFALSGALLAVIGLIAVSGPPWAVGEPRARTISTEVGPDKGQNGRMVDPPIEINEVPVAVQLDIRHEHRITAALRDRYLDDETPDYVLQIWEKGAVSAVDTGDDPPHLDLELRPGRYRLVVTTYDLMESESAAPSRMGLGDILPALAARLASVVANSEALLPHPTQTVPPAQLGLWLAKEPTAEQLRSIIGYAPGEEPAPEEITAADSPAGPVQPGSVVICRKPEDLDEGPGWVSEMDPFDGVPLTIVRFGSFGSFEVSENDYWWDLRWIEKIESGEGTDLPEDAARVRSDDAGSEG